MEQTEQNYELSDDKIHIKIEPVDPDYESQRNDGFSYTNTQFLCEVQIKEEKDDVAIGPSKSEEITDQRDHIPQTNTDNIPDNQRDGTADIVKSTVSPVQGIYMPIDSVTMPEETTVCNICQKEFKSKLNLSKHVRLVHSTDSVKCDQCDKVFKNEMLMKRHKNWIHPTDGMTYDCDICGRRLPSLICYKKHLHNVHNNSQNVVCNICNKPFKTPKTLQKHISVVHGDKKPEHKEYKVGELQCPDCDKIFVRQSSLDWHVKRVHIDNLNADRNSYCTLCNKFYFNEHSLQRHLREHHTTDPVPCQICSKIFRTDYHLQRHLRITHAPPEAAKTCPICAKTYKCALHLRMHMREVHPNASDTFVCEICQKKFQNKKYLEKHRKRHVRDLDAVCPICNKLYKNLQEVARHCKRMHFKDSNVDKSVVTTSADTNLSGSFTDSNMDKSIVTTSDNINLSTK